MDTNFKQTVFYTTIFLGLIIFTHLISKYGYLHGVINFIQPAILLPEFLAGLLYTSFFTAPISVAAFFVISKYGDPLVIALVGGLGAMISDLLILKFMRFLFLGRTSPLYHNLLLHTFVLKLRASSTFKYYGWVLGVVIIAAPLPDEIGLAALGLSNLKYRELAIITFLCNALGILLIVLSARSF